MEKRKEKNKPTQVRAKSPIVMSGRCQLALLIDKVQSIPNDDMKEVSKVLNRKIILKYFNLFIFKISLVNTFMLCL